MRKLLLGFFIALTSSLAWGTTVTPFSLPWMNNHSGVDTFKSSDYPGAIFVVEAYFLGCPYCNDNAANVDALATEFAGDPRVHVLDVGVDTDKSDYDEWISRHNPNHPVLDDGSEQLIGQLGTQGFPSTYVIDCKGNVTAQTSGEWGDSEKSTIEDGVKALQAQQCTNQ